MTLTLCSDLAKKIAQGPPLAPSKERWPVHSLSDLCTYGSRRLCWLQCGAGELTVHACETAAEWGPPTFRHSPVNPFCSSVRSNRLCVPFILELVGTKPQESDQGVGSELFISRARQQEGLSERRGGRRQEGPVQRRERRVLLTGPTRRAQHGLSGLPFFMGVPRTVTEQGRRVCALTHTSVTEGTPGSEVLSHRWAGNTLSCVRVCVCPCLCVHVGLGCEPGALGRRVCRRGAPDGTSAVAALCPPPPAPPIALGVPRLFLSSCYRND